MAQRRHMIVVKLKMARHVADKDSKANILSWFYVIIIILSVKYLIYKQNY